MEGNKNTLVTTEVLTKSVINLAVESWRFSRTFFKIATKLDAGEKARYISHFSWFTKKIEEFLADAGLRVVNVEGLSYDPGLAVTPLNIEDFKSDDALIVNQMLEPIIMKDEVLMRTGIVTLGRKEL